MTRPLSLPPAYTERIHAMYGPRGEAWLRALPALLAEFAERWSLTLELPFADLSYNYAAPAWRADGEAVVLKVGVPNKELVTEAEALRLYAGRGSVRLLAADVPRGALLLERLLPGAPLAQVDDDDQATRLAAGVMRSLWVPAPAEHSFPTAARWMQGLARLRQTFQGGTGPFPAALVAQAEALSAELLASAEAPRLLHGDLHHYNILSAERAPWLALDPKGVVGEAAFEAGALLLMPFGVAARPDLRRLLARRLDLLADELALDRQRLWGWCLARAVLSAWWTYEDEGRTGDAALTCAAALAAGP